ncbi:hypothetical protein OK006_1626 [Actinobacteria bacterium OK006]|nr:hypothetical protein OK006_1626 [Actinobacteria bacterium OK006]
MELGQQRAVLVVGLFRGDDGEDGGVLQLAGEGVGDRAPVGGGRGEADLGEVVAVGEVGQEQGRVDGGDHGGQPEPSRRDDLGHGLGLDRVPQFDDGEACQARVREAPQLRHQILAQGAARAVVDERGLARRHDSGGVPDRTDDCARRGRRQVVVEGDAVGNVGEQPCDGGLPRIRVQAADDHDAEMRGRHQPAPPRLSPASPSALSPASPRALPRVLPSASPAAP